MLIKRTLIEKHVTFFFIKIKVFYFWVDLEILEIDLLQSFQVAYVVITMAGSPRPGVWALEKSMNNGITWKTWQYFASNDAECQWFFGIHAHGRQQMPE